MIDGDVNEFVDCIAFEDCKVRYKGYRYWFDGICYDDKTKEYSTYITKYEDKVDFVFVEDIFVYSSSSKDDVMFHLLNDKIFDGKSFYEVEAEMQWIDW